MKKQLLLILLAMLLPVCCYGYDFNYNGISYQIIDRNAKTVKLYDGKSASGDLILPSKVSDGNDEYTVLSIGYNAFFECSELTSVVIPNSVETIGYSAFYECSNLTSATIGNSVRTIEQLAFAYCSGLTSVVIPNSVETIESAAFGECNNLTSVTIGNSVRTIGQLAFAYCSELTSVIIPNSVQTIGENAFYECNNLTSVTIGNSVRTIGQLAFAYCSELTSVIISNSVQTIGENAFYKCSKLKKSAYPDNISNPFPTGLCLCYPAEGAIIEDGWVYGPEKSAIYFAPLSLEGEYTVPNTVRTIDHGAFINCSGLTSVVLPKSVQTIRSYAFEGCSGLEKAEFESIETLCKINFENSFANPLYYANHLYIKGEEVTSVEIPNSVQSIGAYAFFSCIELTSVNIGSSVQFIGANAFQNCFGLTSITLDNSVQTIDKYAFSNCNGLTSIEIPNSIDTINEGVFAYCSGLTSVVIPNSIQSLGYGAFYNCFGLTSVEIPNSVKYIGNLAFYGCSNLPSIEIPNSVRTIGNNAFKDCCALTSISLLDGENILEFSENVFYNVPIQELFIGRPFTAGYFEGSDITKLTIGNMMTEIGSSEFKGCDKIETLKLGSSLTAIGDEAFANIPGLESIIMGHSVKSIGTNAFAGAPANTVSITAQVPPTAPDDTFSSYTGKLWLQDPGDNSVVNAYYNASTCWNRFDSYTMVSPVKIEGETQEISGKPGETFQLTAKVLPENVTMPQIFWRSTNPDIATVDENGLVTIHADISDIISRARSEETRSCNIIAETLYADGPVLEVTVYKNSLNDDPTTGVNKIDYEVDYGAEYEVYNLSGIKVSTSIEGLERGYYIVRQGSVVKKIAIK